MQAAIAKRLATIAQSAARGCWKQTAAQAEAMPHIPAIGAALIRAGKVGASPKTLSHAAGCTVAQAQHVLDALESGGFAMEWGEDSGIWRLDTVQVLAHENRAALESLESATRAEKEQAATGIAKRKENAPQAQTGGKNGGR